MMSNKPALPTPHSTTPDSEDVYVFPMSFAQQRLWMIDQIFPGNLAYNILMIRHLQGAIDLDAMQASIDFIIQRHEALRTTFTRHKGEPVQVIHSAMPVELVVDDLRSMPAEEAEAERKRLSVEIAERPYDLLRGPLFLSHLVRMEDEDAYWLIGMHHIISDGRSMSVFFDEFRTCYEAYIQGETPVLQPLPVQYADYTVWQRKWLDEGVRDRQLAYWKTHLESRPERLMLPTRSGLQQSLRDEGRMLEISWDEDLITALRAISRSQNATLFMTLMAAFVTLLYRYTGQTDISLGMPIANRNQIEIERLIGFFVNTLVVRTDLSGDPSFEDVLTQVRLTTLNAYQNQDLPFEELVKIFETDRSSVRNPLVQILFNYISDSLDPRRIANLKVSRVTRPNFTAIFDLTITIHAEHADPRISYRYNTELFDDAMIRQMAAHYNGMLKAIVANPAGRISAYAMLSPDEKRRIIHDWNPAPAPLPAGETLQSLFERQVTARPEAAAVIEGEQRLTYRQLNEQATQIAAALQAAGVQTGDMVGLYLRRSRVWVAAVLGVLKAGGIYVPLAVTDPGVRTRQILADSGARIAITQPEYEARLADWDGECVSVDADWLANTPLPTDPISVGANAESPVYLMYTSGSTGVPKGVLIPQRGVLRLVLDQAYLSLGHESVIAHASNIAFDAATFEIWGPLLNGGRLVILEQETILSAEKLRQAIVTQGITGIFLTTALFNQLVSIKPDLFEGMDSVIFGGEAGDPQMARKVLDTAHPPRRLFNAYGPTEATTFALMYDTAEMAADAQVLPIGRPIQRATAYVVDAHMNLLPAGVTGELVLGGPGVGLGYHQRPELTAERFVADPFSDIDGATLYRTGDLVRADSEGVIEFVGRVDNQVKLHGFRVEPGEIEHLLRQAPHVQDALVVIVDDAQGEKAIHGYVVAHTAEANEGAILDYLQGQLPHYMIPRHVMILDAFPLTANGKVDRKALPAPTVSSQKEIAAPRNEVETLLLDIWRDALGLEEIGIHDDFFSLGGHSLLAISLLSQIESTFKHEVALSLLFDSPTIATQALALKAMQGEKAEALVPMRPNGSRQPLYMIHPGGGMLFTYTDLVSHFPADLPVYGLQAQGLRGEAEPHTNIEEMAAYYVQAIRQHQPQGPYQLCGFSGGGVIAYEMAVQLQALGEKTGALLMLDAILTAHPYSQRVGSADSPDGIGKRLADFGTQVRQTLAADIEALRDQPAGQKLTFAVRRIAHHWEWQVTRRWKASPEETDPMMHPEWEPEKKVLWAIRNALDDYNPGPYGGKVTYIQASNNQRPNAYRVWDEVADELELITFEGDHLEIVKGEQAADLAALISDLLEA